MGVERAGRVFGTSDSPVRLISIRASAGRGKTVAVRRWVTTVDDAVVLWPNATPAPQTAASFWVRALTHLHSHGRLDDRLLNQAITAPSAARTILATALAAVDERTTLVIDDLNAEASDATYRDVVDAIPLLLDDAPEVQIVVIERGPTALDDVTLGRHERLDLTVADLISFATDFTDTARGGSALHRPLRDLLPDAYDQMNAGLCALLPVLDEKRARLVVGSADAREVLDGFAAAGLGWWSKGGDDEPRFVFWPRIRETALDELRRARPTQLRAVAHRLARWYVQHGDYETALGLAITSDDVALIDHIALRSFSTWVTLDHEQLARLSALPAHRVRNSAIISMLLAMHKATDGPPSREARAHLQAALVATRRRGDATNPTDQLILIAIASNAYHRIGSANQAIDAALRFARRSRAVLAAHRFDESLARAYAAAAYNVGVTLILGDVSEHEHATILFGDLEEFCSVRGIDDYRNSARSARSYLAALAGRVPQSEAFAMSAGDGALPAPWTRDASRSFVMLSAAVRAALTADFPAMSRQLHTFMSSMRPTKFDDILLYAEVTGDLTAGNAGAARVRFDQAEMFHNTTRRQSKPSVTRRFWYLRHALALVGEAPHSLGAMPPKATEDPIALALSAAIDLDRGDTAGGSVKLANATARVRTPFAQHLAFVVLARLAEKDDDTEALYDATSQLLVLLKSEGLRIGFILLSERHRAAILATLAEPADMRAAFEAVPVSSRAKKRSQIGLLTSRELTVIRALAVKEDRLEVARELHLSPGTVKTHLRAIYRKLGAHSEHEALQKAAAAGLLAAPTQ